MIRLPGENGWKTSTASDLLGNIVRTRGVDFNEDGYLTLSKKPTAIYTEHAVAGTGDADFQDPFAIAADSSYYYVFTIDHVFGFTISETAITIGEVSTSSQPTFAITSDAVSYNSAIACTGSTTLDYLSSFNGSNGGGTWNNASDFSLSASYPHPLSRIEHRNTLAVGDGNQVKQTDAAAWTDDDTNILTLPSEYIVTAMAWRGNKLYIATRTYSGTNAMLFVWSGSGTSAEAGYPVDSDWIYSIIEYDSSVALLTATGQLLRFNGSGFDVLANLPVYYTPYSWSENATGQNIGKVARRGMWANGDIIYFSITGEPRGLFSPSAYKQPGGLWCYNPRVGLYHKAGFTTEAYRILSISDLQSSEFTFASAHLIQTGDPIWAHTVTNIAALTAGYVYYAIKTGASSFKIAASPADAYAGRHITCSGTINGDKLAVDTYDAVANTTSLVSGPIHGFNKNQFSKFFASEMLYAGSAKDPVDTTIASLMSLGESRSVGYVVTPKLTSKGLKDALQSITASIRGLHLDSDKVVVKYRTRERFGLPAATLLAGTGVVTWVDSTSFTLSTAGKDIQSAEVGDEVEFVRGAGAGYSAHITEIDDTTSTWTITIDEAIPDIAASDRSDIYVDNWTKLATITRDTQYVDEGFFDQPLEGSSAWIQFKIELRGANPAISLLQLTSTVDRPQ